MVNEVLPVLGNMFSSLLSYCFYTFEQLGAWTLVFGAFLIYAIYRVIINPIIGASIGIGASDTVRNFKKNNLQNKANNSKKS